MASCEETIKSKSWNIIYSNLDSRPFTDSHTVPIEDEWRAWLGVEVYVERVSDTEPTPDKANLLTRCLGNCPIKFLLIHRILPCY